MSMLKVENLSVHYGMIQAVRDVSFEVNEGEVVSLIGANGAGKTTILRTISGLVRPSAGKIEFVGNEIQKVPAQKNRSSRTFASTRRSTCLSRTDRFGEFGNGCLSQNKPRRKSSQSQKGLLSFPTLGRA